MQTCTRSLTRRANVSIHAKVLPNMRFFFVISVPATLTVAISSLRLMFLQTPSLSQSQVLYGVLPPQHRRRYFSQVDGEDDSTMKKALTDSVVTRAPKQLFSTSRRRLRSSLRLTSLTNETTLESVRSHADEQSTTSNTEEDPDALIPLVSVVLICISASLLSCSALLLVNEMYHRCVQKDRSQKQQVIVISSVESPSVEQYLQEVDLISYLAQDTQRENGGRN